MRFEEESATRTPPSRSTARLPARIYARVGSRILLVGIVVNGFLAMMIALLTAIWVARYTGASRSDLWVFVAIAVPVDLVAGVLPIFRSQELTRTVLSWRAEGRTADRAPEVWDATVSWTSIMVRRGGLTALATLVPISGLFVAHESRLARRFPSSLVWRRVWRPA